MSNREVMQQALEALENIDKAMPFPVGKQAITALREALEQPEQEPTCPKCKAVVLYECVACSNNNYPPRPEQEPCIGKDSRCPCQDGDACHYKDCGSTKALPVPVAQPGQEPVAHVVVIGDMVSVSTGSAGLKSLFDLGDGAPLYTAPPAAQPEPTPWREMVVVSLVREGVNKHRARELADHFAAQRPWVGLTEQDMPSGEDPMFDHQYFCAGMVYAAKVLQEKNT